MPTVPATQPERINSLRSWNDACMDTNMTLTNEMRGWLNEADHWRLEDTLLRFQQEFGLTDNQVICMLMDWWTERRKHEQKTT